VTRRQWRTTAAAAALTAAAALLCVWAEGEDPASVQARRRAIAMPDLRLPAAPPLAALSETLARPLFSPARRPLPAPSGAPADSASPASALVAVALGPGRSAAILKLASGGTAVLMQGERIEGWTLAAVSPHSVTLRSADRSAELTLPGHASWP
jgi:hypothetical protein